MLLVDGKKDALHPDYARKQKDEIGDGRYIQSPKELLSQLKTKDENVVITVGPHMGNVEFSDTFYGTILRSEKDDEFKGMIAGIDFNKNARSADHHKVRYYETATQSTRTIDTLENFKPPYFSIGGTNKQNTAILEQQDYEKYWFLSVICRKVKNSLNAHANTTKDFIFEITTPEKDATAERMGGRFKRKAEFLVNEEAGDGGFTIEQLESIGRFLNLPLKQYRNNDQLRKAILLEAAKDESARVLSGDPLIKGYEYIVLLGQKKGPDQELRELITEAVDKGILEHDTSRKQWVIKSNGNIIANFCPVDDAAPIKVNALISFLKLDIEARERLEGLMGWGDETNEESTTELVASSTPPADTTTLIASPKATKPKGRPKKEK